MKDISYSILNMISEEFDNSYFDIDVGTYPLGTEIEKTLGGEYGSPYFEILFRDKDIKDSIYEIKEKITECKKNITANCKRDILEDIKNLKKKFDKKGLLFNTDILDNFWDKLNGVW